LAKTFTVQCKKTLGKEKFKSSFKALNKFKIQKFSTTKLYNSLQVYNLYFNHFFIWKNKNKCVHKFYISLL
jgi:hypothetical protein